MNKNIVPPSQANVVAAAETVRRHRALVISWFVFIILAAGAMVASRVSAQQPPPKAGAKPAAGKPAAAQPAAKPVARAPIPAAAPVKYDVIAMHPAFADEKIVQRMERAAKGLVTQRDLASYSEMSYAKPYFLNYIPAKITQPEASGEISSLVNESLQLYIRAQRSRNPGGDQMLLWLDESMKKIATGNYSPAARINATLVLVKLEQKPISSDGPPVPYFRAYSTLLALYQDAKNPDGVRAAALQGVHRMVTYGFPLLPDNMKAPLSVEMKKLLKEATPAGRSPKAHAFMQRYAVDILDVIAPANDNSLATELVSLSTAKDQPDLIALYSAARLGTLPRLDGQVPEPATVLQSWSARALQAFEAELARLTALTRPVAVTDQPPAPEQMIQEKPKVTSPMGGMGMDSGYEDMMEGSMMDPGYDESMMGDSMNYDMEMMNGYGMGGYGMAVPEANPQPPEVIASRKKLNYMLQQLQRGVTGSGVAGPPRQAGGLLKVAGEADKVTVENWVTTIGDVVTNLNDKTHDDREKYMEALRAQIAVLRELAGLAPAPAAADDGLPAMPVMDALMPVIPGG